MPRTLVVCKHGIDTPRRQLKTGLRGDCIECSKSREKRTRLAPIEERFWDKVTKTDGCWTWNDRRNYKGYGYAVRNRKSIGAHRLAWEITNGPIPDGLFVLHKCDNPPCVRPDHLFIGTPADNMADKMQKGRYRRGKSNPQQGEAHYNARLTNNDIKAIRSMGASGHYTSTDIGKMFPVSTRYIRAIIQKKVWKHIKDD